MQPKVKDPKVQLQEQRAHLCRLWRLPRGRIALAVGAADGVASRVRRLEDQLDDWVNQHAYPDMIIIGGASGVDYLAERWADNQNIPLAVYTEAWQSPRPNTELDSGRPEAIASLASEMLKHATHMLAFPGPDSVWTKRMIEIATTENIPVIRVDLPTEGL